MQYIWSTEALTLDDVGKNVPVICYDKSGETYPVIAVNAKNDLFTPVGVTGSGYTGPGYEAGGR